MKPRIEKKVSKKLHAILGDAFGKVWIDDEIERCPLHYAWETGNEGMLTPKQKRRNYEQRVSVNHIPSVGGEYCSYVGDTREHYTLYDAACGALMWEGYDVEEESGWPLVDDRINARWSLRKAREYMARR